MENKKSSAALILDDHALFNDSFSSLIEKLEVFNSVFSFTEEKEMLHFLLKNEFAVTYLFLDYYLKDNTSLSVLNDAKRMNKKIKIVYVSSLNNSILLRKILQFSPNGMISKSSGFDVILKCIKSIEKKELYICPVFKEILKTESKEVEVSFTQREIEVLQIFAQGHNIEQSSELLHLSKHTVVAHRRNMMTKANCKSITELLYYSRKRGII